MNILVCVSGASQVEPAVGLGGILTCINRSKLTMLHIISPQEDWANGEELVASACELLPDRAVDRRIRQGDPTQEILNEIEEGNYDLVIVGDHEADSLREHVLGSVAAQVVRRVPLSVLVAKQAKSSLDRILICTGGLHIAERVIRSGAWLAKGTGAEVTLLHVVTPVASMYTGLRELEETLPQLLKTDTPIAQHLRHGANILHQEQVDADLKLRYGVAADEIIREGREGNYDLVVIGAAKRDSRLQHWLLGSVTREVVDKTRCSVMVVKRALAS